MRTVLVVNPTARAVARRPGLAEAVAAAWRRLGPVEVIASGGSAAAAEIVAAGAGGFDVVATLGGDGTLNAVANALADAAAASGRGVVAALAPLPGGSTNVFARSIGLDRDPLAATAQLVAAAAAGARVPVSAGRLDGRLFLANAGIGFDAAVVARADRHHEAKRRLGAAWFSMCVAAEVARRDGVRPGRAGGPRLRVEGAGPASSTSDGWAWLVALARSPYTYLGAAPVDLEPRRTDRGAAEPGAAGRAPLGDADGAADPTLVGVTGLGHVRLLRAVARATISSHGVIDNSHIARISATFPVRVRSDAAIPAQVDGDHLRVAEQFVITSEPAAFDRLAVSPVGAPITGSRPRRRGPRPGRS